MSGISYSTTFLSLLLKIVEFHVSIIGTAVWGVSINILPKPKNFAKTPSKVLSEGEIVSPKELCKI